MGKNRRKKFVKTQEVKELKMLHFRNLWLMSHKCKHMCTLHVDHLSTMTSKRVDTNLTISKQNQIFEEEKRRQIESVKRIEKIEVHYKGVPEDLTLYMNKALSTPFNVAQHISEVAVDRSALALVNGNPWDMHRPLQEECSLELIHFHDRDPFHLNKLFGDPVPFFWVMPVKLFLVNIFLYSCTVFLPQTFTVAVLSMISISVGTNGTPPKKS